MQPKISDPITNYAELERALEPFVTRSAGETFVATGYSVHPTLGLVFVSGSAARWNELSDYNESADRLAKDIEAAPRSLGPSASHHFDELRASQKRSKISELPFAMNLGAMASFAWSWLQTQPRYPAWNLYLDRWGSVGGCPLAIASLRPSGKKIAPTGP